MSEEALRNAATWHSRMVVLSEFLCAFLWLMPRKVASFVAIVVLCGIALTNNLSLFSVVIQNAPDTSCFRVRDLPDSVVSGGAARNKAGQTSAFNGVALMKPG